MRFLCLLAAFEALVPSLAYAQKKLPDACTVLTLADVAAEVGSGYAKSSTGELLNSSEISSCLYQKGAGTTVALTVMRAPEDDGRAAVTARQEGQRRGGRTVASLSSACDTAFSIIISPSQAIVLGGKGPWQLDFQVVTGGKPDVAAAGRVASAACKHL